MPAWVGRRILQEELHIGPVGVLHIVLEVERRIGLRAGHHTGLVEARHTAAAVVKRRTVPAEERHIGLAEALRIDLEVELHTALEVAARRTDPAEEHRIAQGAVPRVDLEEELRTVQGVVRHTCT